MTSEYNLPLHVSSQNGDDYVIDDGYPHDGVTPPGMTWDAQGDGGGKFRLKRRRRCGQCAPCQVKENCNKCQYCMRKDVLKQACVYRKCVYLRKPVPRFRQEAPTGQVQKAVPTPPRKPPSNQVSAPVTNSVAVQNGNNNTTTAAPMPALPSPASVPSVTSSQQAELSSCRHNQSPFASLSVMNNSMLDPLRHRMMEHSHRGTLYDTISHHHQVFDPTKSSLGDMSRYPSGPVAGLNSAHCKLDQGAASVSHSAEINLAAVAAAAVSPLNAMNSHQANKALPSRDTYFSTMDTWGSMPYTWPRPHTWGPPALPNHHAAAAYGFQQHSTPFPSSFTPSSCRLGLPDSATARYSSPQHSFHHSMAGFSQDLTHPSATHANHRSPMSGPFYPTPPHITSSSIPSFTSLGQFPPNQASFGPTAYPMHPHAHMYPGSFYSPFRTATEPQIYHVHILPSQNPFKNFISSFINTLSERKDKLKNKLLEQYSFKEFNSLDFSKSGAIDFNFCFKRNNKSVCFQDAKKSIPLKKKHFFQIDNNSLSLRSKDQTLNFCKEGSNSKNSRETFQNSIENEEMFKKLDELSYLPDYNENFVSLSDRLADNSVCDTDIDDSISPYHLKKSRQMSLKASFTGRTYLSSTATFTNVKMWLSSYRIKKNHQAFKRHKRNTKKLYQKILRKYISFSCLTALKKKKKS